MRPFVPKVASTRKQISIKRSWKASFLIKHNMQPLIFQPWCHMLVLLWQGEDNTPCKPSKVPWYKAQDPEISEIYQKNIRCYLRWNMVKVWRREKRQREEDEREAVTEKEWGFWARGGGGGESERERER